MRQTASSETDTLLMPAAHHILMPYLLQDRRVDMIGAGRAQRDDLEFGQRRADPFR